MRRRTYCGVRHAGRNRVRPGPLFRPERNTSCRWSADSESVTGAAAWKGMLMVFFLEQCFFAARLLITDWGVTFFFCCEAIQMEWDVCTYLDPSRPPHPARRCCRLLRPPQRSAVTWAMAAHPDHRLHFRNDRHRQEIRHCHPRFLTGSKLDCDLLGSLQHSCSFKLKTLKIKKSLWTVRAWK